MHHSWQAISVEAASCWIPKHQNSKPGSSLKGILLQRKQRWWQNKRHLDCLRSTQVQSFRSEIQKQLFTRLKLERNLHLGNSNNYWLDDILLLLIWDSKRSTKTSETKQQSYVWELFWKWEKWSGAKKDINFRSKYDLALDSTQRWESRRFIGIWAWINYYRFGSCRPPSYPKLGANKGHSW